MKLFQNSAIALGLLGGLALWNMPPSYAQTADIAITGGSANFENTKIFVPQPGDSVTFTEVYEGSTPTEVIIQTQQGNIPTNALFRTSILPQLSTQPGGTPAVGDTGRVLGTLSFVSPGNSPVFYSRIPVTLEFRVDTISSSSGCPCLGTPEAVTRYRTRPFLFSEFGSAQSGGVVIGRTTRETPVVLPQYQPTGTPPRNLGIIPASFFTFSTPGRSFSADFDTTLTGGSVTVPNPPGLINASNPGGSGSGISSDPITPIIIIIRNFDITISPRFVGYLGRYQWYPVMPFRSPRGWWSFTRVPRGYYYDPPLVASSPNMTMGFDFEMTPNPEPIGLASRVFPGMTGVSMSDESLFTQISGLPKGIDRDERFTISVDGKVIGEFTSDQTVTFSDYKAILGDSLINGEGVKSFTVSGINPGVDQTNPLAFPIKLEFNTPTASFDMRASEQEAVSSAAIGQ